MNPDSRIIEHGCTGCTGLSGREAAARETDSGDDHVGICGCPGLQGLRLQKKSCASCTSMSINPLFMLDFGPVSNHQAQAFVSAIGGLNLRVPATAKRRISRSVPERNACPKRSRVVNGNSYSSNIYRRPVTSITVLFMSVLSKYCYDFALSNHPLQFTVIPHIMWEWMQ